ncbi:MAG: deoxyribonuclease IV [Verrucomicrobia bacterium]|nr:deoxyribonuclease IV [Verrucomicrobiota bacterium]
MKKTPAEKLLIGAHTSAQGGAHNALLIGEAIGATTVQLFTSNQKRWVGKEISGEEVQAFQDALAATGLSHIMSHDSYLINLGSPDKEGLHKSRKAFKEELIRCQKLGITYLNFHPGAALDGTVEECLDRIVESLLDLEALASKGETRILLETTAGQGSSVGYLFEHLGYIVDRVHKKIPIGVCIDTCHIFAAGYDIRTRKGWEETLEKFEKDVGLHHLYAFHVNDSLKPFASRKDRHAPLGKGEIGIECFEVMMTHPKLREIPKYLETPDGPPLWKYEIAQLRKFAS